MEKYLGDEELTEDDIKLGLRKGTLAFSFVPVLCGSAFKNKGVQPMLDAVVDFLPSPLDIPPATAPTSRATRIVERKADENAPFAALAFKIVADPHSASSPTSGSTPASSTRATRSTTPPRTAGSGSGASC